MLSSGEIQGYMDLIPYALVHKYTKSAVVAGTVDTWKMAQPTYPVTVTDIPCNYLSAGTLTRRDRSVSMIETPTIMIPATDNLKVGDKVTNIKDSNGLVVVVGPLYVTEVETAMGFGPVTNYIATLSGQRPVKW